MTNRSWRVDETYVRIAGKWSYLYRAVDSSGDTIDFLLSPKRYADAAKRLFQNALESPNYPRARVINVDRNPAYPRAIDELRRTGELGRRCRCRPVRYLNNVVEIVFTQMTKAGGFGAGMGRNHISDLNLIVDHQDSIHQQFHKNPVFAQSWHWLNRFEFADRSVQSRRPCPRSPSDDPREHQVLWTVAPGRHLWYRVHGGAADIRAIARFRPGKLP